MKSTSLAAAAALLALLSSTQPLAAQEPRALRIAADILPIKALVDAVVEDMQAIDLIIDPDVSVHNHSLRPSQARSLANADVVFHLGRTLSPWLVPALKSISPQARSVELRAASTSDNDSLANDPHTWLDPVNAIEWLGLISEELATLDPENANSYQLNASRAASKIDASMLSVEQHHRALSSRRWLAYHDSLGWFSKRFSITPVGVVTSSNGEPPGAAHFSSVRELVRTRQVDCMLTAPGASERAIAALDEDARMLTIAIDPLGRELPIGAEFYPALIKSLTSAIDNCQTG